MRNVQIAAGCYYHIYNRGANRQPIFFCDENWVLFLRKLHHYFVPDVAQIVAYCLMPNHYHLLVAANSDDVGTKAMQPLSMSFAKAVNKQQQRSGHLFQGPFQVKAVDRDSYLKWLTRYIHLNPVAAGLVVHPENWLYSSYREYIGLRHGTLPHPQIVLGQFPSSQAYARFVEDDLPIAAGLPREVLISE